MSSRQAGAEALDVERVSLRALLSACADAALRGCEEIRAVQHARASGSEVASKLKDADALQQQAAKSSLLSVLLAE